MIIASGLQANLHGLERMYKAVVILFIYFFKISVCGGSSGGKKIAGLPGTAVSTTEWFWFTVKPANSYLINKKTNKPKISVLNEALLHVFSLDNFMNGYLFIYFILVLYTYLVESRKYCVCKNTLEAVLKSVWGWLKLHLHVNERP